MAPSDHGVSTTTSLRTFMSLAVKTRDHVTAKGWRLCEDGWWRHNEYHDGATGASLGMAASETMNWERREEELREEDA